MSLFLTILKIIGIVLLVILAVVLVVLLLLLFVPIRYYVNADIEETNLETEVDKLKDRIQAKAGFHFLLHLIRGYIEYPKDMEFTVKVLFFKVFPGKNKGEDTTEEFEEELPYEMEEGFENQESEESESEQPECDAETSKEESKDESQNEVQAETQNADIEDSDSSAENDDSNPDGAERENDASSEEDFDDEEEEEKQSFLDVLKKIKDIVVQIIKTPQNVYQKIKCTISSIYAKIDMVKKTLENDIFKRAFNVSKKQVLRVLKMIIPRKCNINLRVGMSDPTATADIFAAYGILYPILAGKVYITPDFENPVIAGSVRIKGRIRLVTIVWAAAVLYFNKDVRKTIRRFKKILNS